MSVYFKAPFPQNTLIILSSVTMQIDILPPGVLNLLYVATSNLIPTLSFDHFYQSLGPYY